MDLIIFDSYPDILNTKHLQNMLGLSKNSILELLKNNEIRHFRNGKKYLIPKLCVMEYVSKKISCAYHENAV